MPNTSGGVRKGNSSRSKGGNFEASVAVQNRNGETRWLRKRFRTQSRGEKWIDMGATRFNSPAKSGFVYTASIDRETKRGTEYDVYYRDLSREFRIKDMREFRAGRRGYTGR